MVKPNLHEQFDAVVGRVLAQADEIFIPGGEEKLAAPVLLAFGLRGLPRENFKARLKADLIRKATTMAGESVKGAVEPQPTVIPRLCFKDTRRAIEFYQSVFGAKEIMRLVDPDQKIGIAQIQIGNARILLSDEYPEFGAISPETLGGSTVKIKLMVPDADTAAQRALAAGAKMVRPVQDEFYGERVGQSRRILLATRGLSPRTRKICRWRKCSGDSTSGTKDRRKTMESNAVVSKAESSESAKAVPYIREGFHTITPYILVGGAAKFIEFMKEAFGAEEKGRVPMPNGKIMHAEVKVGDSMIELSDGNEQYGPTPVALHYYVEDADAIYARAIEAGAIRRFTRMMDQPYGDREGGVKDPFGNSMVHRDAENLRADAGAIGQRAVVFVPARRGENDSVFGERVWSEGGGRARITARNVIAHATVRIGDATLEFSEAHGEY